MNTIYQYNKHFRVFFIVGRARSGTTLLRTMLDAHPQVIIPFECPFIQHLSGRYGNITKWDVKTLTRFYNDLIKQPAFNLLNIDHQELKAALVENAGVNNYADICKIVIRQSRSVFPKNEISILGDKNPCYSLVIPLISKSFPEAKFIHMTRDYRDNILSMIRVDFEARFVSSLAYRWKFYNKRIQKAKEKNPEKFYTVRYEDLIEEPKRYLKEICSFIGIEYKNELLHFDEMKKQHYAIYPEEAMDKYHSNLFQPVNNDHAYGWKKKMNERSVKIADAVVGNSAEQYGYERKFKKTGFFTSLICLPGIAYGRLYFVWGDFVNAMPHSIRMGIIHFLAGIFKPYWKRYKMKDKA